MNDDSTTGNNYRRLPGIGYGRVGGGWHGGGSFQTNPNYRHQPRRLCHNQVRKQQSLYVQRQNPTREEYHQMRQWLRRSPNFSSSSTANTVEDAKGNGFEDYLLKRELLMGIYEKGFVIPSPIQEEIIPIALSGRDILAKAKTGTGKTSAFCIPVLEKISIFRNAIQVVILVPTREVAFETSQVCKELGKHLKIQVMVTTGMTSVEDDLKRLCRPVHLLIGTPGRILQLTKRADKLLCPELQPCVEDLISNFFPMKSRRQILMFSATFSDTVQEFRMRYLKSPYLVNPMDELTLLFQAAEVGWLEKESLTLRNKVRFVIGTGNRTIPLCHETEAELANHGLTPMPKVASSSIVADASKTTMIPGTEYDYLLSMPVGSWLDENEQRLLEKSRAVDHLLSTETDALEKQLRLRGDGDGDGDEEEKKNSKKRLRTE